METRIVSAEDARLPVHRALSELSPQQELVEQRLSAAVRSHLLARAGSASAMPLRHLIEKAELPRVAALQDLTLREILERAVGPRIKRDDAAVGRAYERILQGMRDAQPLHDMLKLDRPIADHPLFRDVSEAANASELVKVAQVSLSDEDVVSLVGKLREFRGASPEFWAALSAENMISDTVQRLRDTFELSRLTFDDLPLLHALTGENIASPRHLISWTAERWREFLDGHDIDPTKRTKIQDRDEYAARLEDRVAQRFPTAVFFQRLNPGDIDRHRDELIRAAHELHVAAAPDSSMNARPSASKKLTAGSVLAWMLGPFRRKRTVPMELTDSSAAEPATASPPSDSDAAREIRSLFSGLGIDDILRDANLSAEQKADRTIQRVRRLAEFQHTNPDIDLLRSDFHRDIYVSTEAHDQGPLLTLDPAAVGELRTLREAFRAQRAIQLSDTIRLVATDGGWRVDDEATGQHYLLYRSGNSIQVFRSIDWTAAGEDREPVKRQLKVYQRLLRVDPRFETVERLLAGGYDSAWKIALDPDNSFRRSFPGDPQRALWLRLRASAITETAGLTYMNAHNAAGTGMLSNAFFENTTEDVIAFLKHIPGYPTLFELPRFCDCEQCKSIFGPAAYLVDLMRFVAAEIESQNIIDPVRSLESRRSDIWDIPLDCENANRLIPYIDIVNEVLERRAQAEIGAPLYDYLYTQAAHPSALPFHLPLAQVRAYLGHFKSCPLFEIFDAFGRPERWRAIEYLGLSQRDIELVTNPAINSGRLALAYGLTNSGLLIPADFWGLVRVDNFLAHTGLTRNELSQLLFQNLDAKERAVPTGMIVPANFGGDRQADFFINNVHDNAARDGRIGSLAVAVNDNDPNDVHEELQNLTGQKLGRIHRFIRLARRLRWSFEDLDWVLRSLGKTAHDQDIDADAIVRLFKIRRWQDRFELPLEVLTTLWFDLKSSGRQNPNGPDPLDLFDRVFNNPRVLRGAPVYNPSGNIGVLLRRFDRTNPGDSYRGWLLATLELTNEELNQIAQTMPVNPAPLTLSNLSYLFRLSRLPRIVGLTVRQFLLFLAGRGVAVTQAAIDAHLRDFDALEETFELIAWATAAGWSVDELDYLRTNQPDEFVDAGFHVDDVRTFLEGLSSNPSLPESAFTALAGVDDAQSRAVFLELVTKGFIARTQPDDPFGRLTPAFAPDVAGFTLGLNPPYDVPAEDIRIVNFLRQYHNPSLPEAARRQRILEGLASFFGIAPALVAALIDLTDEPMNAARIDILTTTVNSADAAYTNIVRFLRKLHTRILIANRFALRVDEIAGLAANAASFGLGALDTVPLEAARNLHRYRMLTNKFGDQDGSLLRFIAGQPADPAQLAAVTRWEQPQLEAVAAALVNNLGLANADDVYRRIDRLERLDRCFALTNLLRIDARTLLDWSDWNNKNWAEQEVVAQSAREAFKARYGEDAWVERFEPIEDLVREMKRDALAAWLVWRYRANSIQDREDLYQFLLIDVNMSSCAKIPRIKEALNALQLYVHRCLMNLETDVSPASIPRKQWPWMKNYRVWEANRKVFLYPENYIEPELRDDKTTLYRELENELLQGDVTKGTVEAAYRNYLDKLAEISNLVIVGTYFHEDADVDPDTGRQKRTLFLIGRTRTEPQIFYYRRYENEIRWTPWERIDLRIKSAYVSPIFAFNRLFIFWVEAAKRQQSQIVQGDSKEPRNFADITVYYSFYNFNHRWTAPQTLFASTVEDVSDSFDAASLRFSPGFHYDPAPSTYFTDRISGMVHPTDEGAGGWLYTFTPALHESLAITDQDGSNLDGTGIDTFLATTSLTNSSISSLVENTDAGGDTTSDYRTVQLWKVENAASEPVDDNDVLLERISPPYRHSAFAGSLLRLSRSAHAVNNRFDWSVFDNVDEQFLIRRVDNSGEVKAFRDLMEMYPELDFAGGPSAYKYQFERISTSIVLTLSRRLLAGGIDRLLSIESQQLTELDFDRLRPRSRLVIGPASDALDFEGPYGQYYREIFFHIPCLIANRLNANQQFEDAQRWYHYVFDPTAAEPSPALAHPYDRYWGYLPFRNQTLPTFQEALSNAAALDVYHENPFQPHAIARLRAGAYPKNVVMKYIDNLIDWAEHLFRQDTWESITEGTMLYVMAYQILGGTPPEQLSPCEQPPTRTYGELEAALNPATAIPEFLIEIENSPAVRPALLFSLIGGAARANGLALNSDLVNNLEASTRNSTSLLYFCFPENQQLRDYWKRVTDGLYKIRHCLDITGRRRQLAPYEPPIDPAVIVRAVAGGRDLSAVLADLHRPLPSYRFAYLIDKSRQFALQVMQFGNALASALEKKDVEELALLRTTHERSIQKLTQTVREQQRDAAVESHAALQAGRAGAMTRQSHYGNLLANGLSSHEQLHLASMMIAWYLDEVSQIMNLSASVAHLVPNAGSPFAITYGGREIGSSLRGVAEAFRMFSSFTNLIASMSSIMGGYQRRAQDWTLQSTLASHDLEQIDRQITAATLQKAIADQEIKILERTQEQSDEMQAFLEDKFTHKDLYSWYCGNLAGLYFQSYQLAVDLAKSAERALQFERNTNETYIQFGHWDSLKKGLLAGERLTLEINQLEKAYIDGNARTLEIEKHISLAQLDPVQLLALKSNGICEFALPEILFDYDFPGHYCRKIKTVALSIPAVAGPYETVKATLSQLSSSILLLPDINAFRYLLGDQVNQPDDSVFRVDWRPREEVAISSASNDAGAFELNFRDERYLPFEGTGAVSRWRLMMPRQTNRINFDTISDVVIHLRYTAVSNDAFRTEVVNRLGADPLRGVRMISVRHEFSAAWQRFLNPTTGSAVQRLEIPVTSQLFPPNVRIDSATRVFLFLEAAPYVRPPGAPGLAIALQPGGARVTTPGNPNASFVFTDRFIESLDVVDGNRALSGPWIAQIDRTSVPPALRRKAAGGGDVTEIIGGQSHYLLDDSLITNLGLILAYEGNVGWT